MNNGDLNNYQSADTNIIYDYTIKIKSKVQIVSEAGICKV